MAHVVEYGVKVTGNAPEQLSNIAQRAEQTSTVFDRLSKVTFGLNNIIGTMGAAWGKVSGALQASVDANRAQQEAQNKLQQVMRNTMDASDAQVRSILELTAAQQQLGIIGDEVQIAGAQELGTYLEQTESLQRLIPVMNDMVAQQYGFNASQESAVGIATMMGKVMEGQTGALSRYGYKFTEAQEQILKYGTEAQKVATLTEVITASVGGMNEALAQTPEGKMQQMQNRIGDLQERIGGLFVRIQAAFAPLMDAVVGLGEEIATWVEQNEAVIMAAVATLQAVVMRTWNVLRGVWNFVQEWSPMILSIAVAVGVLTAAIKMQSIVMAIHTAKTKLATTATTLLTAAQAALNAIMKANPIGLIITGIVAAISLLVGLITMIVKKWNEWGAAVSLLLGPVGTIISLVIAFREQWESIVEAFKSDGFMAGIKRIGVTLLESLLMPLQQLMEIMAKVPGIGKYAAAAAQKLAAVRDKYGLTKPKAVEETPAQQGTNAALVAAVNGREGTRGGTATTATTASASAVATGGTRSTTVNISIGDMIRELHFNGTTQENQQQIERTFAECLSRVLAMAGA